MTNQQAIEFFVPGIPQPQGSKKAFVVAGKRSACVVDDNHETLRDWRARVAFFASNAWTGPPLRGAVRVDRQFRFKRPPSVSAKRRPYPCVKPDADKLSRALMDALTGICFADDALVCDGRESKIYADSPGVFVVVEDMNHANRV